MVFFRTTVKDIKTYKKKGNYKKLVAALHYKKDLQVVFEAINALIYIENEDSLKEMIRIFNLTSDENKNDFFIKAIRNKPSLFMKLFEKCIIEDIYTIIKEKEKGIRLFETYPEGYKQFLIELDEISVPMLENLLEHKYKDVRIFSAEVLHTLNAEDSKSRYNYILDNEIKTEIVELRFKKDTVESVRLKTEYPILEIINIELKKDDEKNLGSYPQRDLGLTDKSIYIVLSSNIKRGVTYVLPLNSIKEIQFKERYTIEILLKKPLSNVNKIVLGLYGIDKYKIKKLIKLFEIFKNKSYNKIDIMKIRIENLYAVEKRWELDVLNKKI